MAGGMDPQRPGSQRWFYGPKLAGDGRPCSAGRPPWPGLVLAMRGGRGRGIGGKEGRQLDGGLATAVAWQRRRVATAGAPHGGGGSAQGAVRVPKP